MIVAPESREKPFLWRSDALVETKKYDNLPTGCLSKALHGSYLKVLIFGSAIFSCTITGVMRRSCFLIVNLPVFCLPYSGRKDIIADWKLGALYNLIN
jgi:hypothetical protein